MADIYENSTDMFGCMTKYYDEIKGDRLPIRILCRMNAGDTVMRNMEYVTISM
jgi:hypothetical protein